MREILFKAKRLDNGEWVEGLPTGAREDGSYYIVTNVYGMDERFGIGNRGEYRLFHDAYRVDPSTVCEYTGLTDKNGKKIFEHDVVIAGDESGEICRFSVAFGKCGGIQNVDHDVGYMGFYFEPNNEETKYCMKYGARNDMIYWLNAYKCEVIGSIHDGEGDYVQRG